MSEDTLQNTLADDESLEGLSYLDMNLEDVWEEVAVEEGEYDVVITSAEVRQKNKGPFLLLRLQITDVPESKDIVDVQMLPDEARMDARELNRRKKGFLDLFDAFGIQYGGRVDVDELVGLTGRADLKVEETPDYGRQNRVRRYIPMP